MSITGEADGDPMKVGVALVDVLTGKDAVIGILAALSRTDSAADSASAIEVNLLSQPARVAGQSGGGVPHHGRTARPDWATSIRPSRRTEPSSCEDGLLVVACGNDAQFRSLTRCACGCPTLAVDERFATNPARVANRDLLTERPRRMYSAPRHRRSLGRPNSPPPACPWDRSRTSPARSRGPSELGLDPTVDVGDGSSRTVRHPITWSRSPCGHPRHPQPSGSTLKPSDPR